MTDGDTQSGNEDLSKLLLGLAGRLTSSSKPIDLEAHGIIIGWTAADIERRREAYYGTFSAQSPEMKGYIEDSIESNRDPLTSLRETRKEIADAKMAFRIVSSMGGLAKIIDGIFGDEDEPENPEMEKFESNMAQIKIIVDMLNSFEELIERQYPRIEKFYGEMVKAVKRVASERGLSIEDTVGNLDCRDAVMKIIFPTRAEAENFSRDDYKANLEMFSVYGEILKKSDAMKASGGPMADLGAKLSTLIKYPSAETLGAFHKAGLEYELAECGRIYGPMPGTPQ